MQAGDHDFIVVGAGPCGAVIGRRLAKYHTVLLIESGGQNDDPANLVGSERHTFWMTPHGRQLDHGYQTVEQSMLNGRRLPYARGKGLGGSTATNLGLWDYGARVDMNHWSALVDDPQWAWEPVKQRMREIEHFHDFTPEYARKYCSGEAEAHGTDGAVDVTLPADWDPSLLLLLETFEAKGWPLNPDLSSGQAVGLGVVPATVQGDARVTASTAYLRSKPSGLDVLTDSPVKRVIFEGRRAIGVDLYDGKRYDARKEIILCAGAIDTPKLLMLSGVGPSDHLSTHGIPVVCDLPGIGTNLTDHTMIRIAAPVKAGLLDRDRQVAEQNGSHSEESAESAKAARGHDAASAAHGYFRVEGNEAFPGFDTLPYDVQAHLRNDSTRAYELVCRIGPVPTDPTRQVWTAVIAIMNSQSTGRVSLDDTRPEGPSVIDLKLLSHPYDIKVALEAVKTVAQFMRVSGLIEDGQPFSPGPQTLEDDAILDFIRASATHLWHAAGTVRMGVAEHKHTCVTPDFKVVGVEGLRVADMSIAPILPSHHPQSTAYLIGETAAKSIVAAYV